ncbi:WRKY transcription factor [Castilleja foliolosa]|uniref:WRKY transcription factor n=1 Tax=Castilleja foliolosa TaxID=1961234 RepID=A0ABD3CQ24_9LAMI
MAIQLQNHINMPSSSRGNHEYLLHKILFSYDQALSIIINSGASGEALAANQDSPPSPGSDDSDNQYSKDHHVTMKRKCVAKWMQKFKVCTETGIETQLDDGYYWRKYGQKDILGTKHPR